MGVSESKGQNLSVPINPMAQKIAYQMAIQYLGTFLYLFERLVLETLKNPEDKFEQIFEEYAIQYNSMDLLRLNKDYAGIFIECAREYEKIYYTKFKMPKDFNEYDLKNLIDDMLAKRAERYNDIKKAVKPIQEYFWPSTIIEKVVENKFDFCGLVF